MLIVFLMWFVALVVVAVLVLVLARAESHRDTFSSRIPDGEEYDERRTRRAEDRRAAARVVAPRMAIAPVDRPVVAEPAGQEAEPVVGTSSKVVEVHAFANPHGPVVAPAAGPDRQEPAHLVVAADRDGQAGKR